MNTIKCYRYNIDTNSVDIVFKNNYKVSIHCESIEENLNLNIITQTRLDYLIYNAPSEYAQLVLSDTMQDYLDKYYNEHTKQKQLLSENKTDPDIAHELLTYQDLY